MSSEWIPDADENRFNTDYKPWESTEKMRNKGLKIAPRFATPGVHPFDEIEWEKRQAKITDETLLSANTSTEMFTRASGNPPSNS